MRGKVKTMNMNTPMDYKKMRLLGIILLIVGAVSIFSPIDAIPDMVPYVGWADDCLACVGGIGGLITLIISEVRLHKLSEVVQ